MAETIKLSDAQLTPFDVDRVVGPRWDRIRSCIDQDFPDGRFTFIDVGGGNGTFADRLLATYPHCTGTVLDNSEMLIGRNVQSDRKQVVLASALEIEPYGQHDIVFCNTLLHHLVGRTYDETRHNISRVIDSASRALTKRGRLSIYEVDCNGIIDGLSSRVLFWLTSSRLLAPFIKQLGANTAGVGVCYLSHKQWRAVLQGAGFGLDSYHALPRRVPFVQKAGLLLRDMTTGHYWAHRL